MAGKHTEKNYCFKHHRDKVATNLICPNCLATGTSPARRRAARYASKCAAEARERDARISGKKTKQRAGKRGKGSKEGDGEIF
jgi:hypothetical protein